MGSSSCCSSNKKKMITLISDNGDTFEIEEAVISQSQTIKYFIEEDDCTDNEIPLPNVSSKILSMVIDYCKKHAPHQDAGADDEVKSWDKEFMNVDEATLLDLTVAATYLNIKSLLHLTSQSVAHMINGKTPEEEHHIRSEIWWAFE